MLLSLSHLARVAIISDIGRENSRSRSGQRTRCSCAQDSRVQQTQTVFKACRSFKMRHIVGIRYTLATTSGLSPQKTANLALLKHHCLQLHKRSCGIRHSSGHCAVLNQAQDTVEQQMYVLSRSRTRQARDMFRVSCAISKIEMVSRGLRADDTSEGLVRLRSTLRSAHEKRNRVYGGNMR